MIESVHTRHLVAVRVIRHPHLLVVAGFVVVGPVNVIFPEHVVSDERSFGVEDSGEILQWKGLGRCDVQYWSMLFDEPQLLCIWPAGWVQAQNLDVVGTGLFDTPLLVGGYGAPVLSGGFLVHNFSLLAVISYSR